ncbi:NADH-flavin reductase [Lactobacillus sp.] [Lactiplantibacillus mudanjiangensis]|uniref:NAD(P)-dependent oxidoreductase n=1 Tax=Lactiplantibacillus mudanjiangensis TaxID=1296538 RepID=UPI0010145386|nr:NAD(P)H-binding protein [Lactiplantibacillus mudanjiangensis]VDG30541.1 NADH-flavin reductase [Lactobacillus sp.] [Lactiplantibacillus mudanjiangensis]
MKILIIGATGMAGSAITAAALANGHTVTALSRSAEKLAQLPDHTNLTRMAKDAFSLTATDLAAVDVVVDAMATPPAQAYLHVDLATKLVAEVRTKTSPRLVFILGAGSLHTGADHHLLVEDIAADPANAGFLAIPQNQLKELTFLQTVDNVDWVGISPAADFHAGPATTALTGTDDLLVNAAGQSVTTAGTMAQAVLAEIEQPAHHQMRFTVANAD